MGQEQQKSFYDRIYLKGGMDKQYHKEAKETSYYLMWQRIVELIPSGSPVLDLGCGVGHLASMIQKAGKKYLMGVDFSEVAIKMALKRNKKLMFLNRNILDDAIYGLPYEVIVMCETLEHINDDLKIFEMIPPDKFVIFSVPNFDSIGHVRYFNDVSIVLDRYRKYLRNIQIDVFELNGNNRIFLIAGATCLKQE